MTETIDVNYLAIVLAALSSMVVGAIWYSKPIFGRQWAKWAGVNDQTMKKGSAVALTLALLMSLVMAFILAHVAFLSNFYFNHSFLQDSVFTALWLWLGIALTRVVTHDAFERRPLRLTILNALNMLVTMVVMGVIIGLLPPASFSTADQLDTGSQESPCAAETDC
jgi:hypothetical protein